MCVYILYTHTYDHGYSYKVLCVLTLCSQNSELYTKKGKFYCVNLPLLLRYI